MKERTCFIEINVSQINIDETLETGTATGEVRIVALSAILQDVLVHVFDIRSK